MHHIPSQTTDEILHTTPDPARLVLIEQSPDYPGELLLQTNNDQQFLNTYRDWISRYMCLNELFMLPTFIDQLQADGWDVRRTPNTDHIFANHHKWSQPLNVRGFTCPGGGQLFPYQNFTLNRALERAALPQPHDRLFFIGWCTGSGKSLAACAGAQEMFNRRLVDIALVFTLMTMKPNLAHAATASFAKTTQLDVVVNDGTKKSRTAGYAEGHQVYVLNYEKLWADFEALQELTSGRRVLWVLDEAHKILTAEPNRRLRTKTRKHFDTLITGCQPTVWPMSASVVSYSPLRYRDVFNLAGNEKHNPLGSVLDFANRYIHMHPSLRALGYRPIHTHRDIAEHTWSLGRLHEVRHRVAPRTQSARKTDPGVREFFKGNTTVVVPVQLSKEDRKLYDLVADNARGLACDVSLAIHYQLLRYICNTPAALRATQSDLGRALAAEHPKLAVSDHSAKLELFTGQLEAIAEQQDKVVAFTHWTNLSLLLISPEIHRRGINHVVHYGVGQSAAESLAAQQRFKTDPAVTMFFSSDAGAHGLNLPEAKYCINYECPYSYDLLMQRSERNNRADTQHDTTTYIYVTEGTVEERIYEVNEERRRLAAATLGTVETLNYGGRATRSEEQNMRYLIFGEKE